MITVVFIVSQQEIAGLVRYIPVANKIEITAAKEKIYENKILGKCPILQSTNS